MENEFKTKRKIIIPIPKKPSTIAAIGYWLSYGLIIPIALFHLANLVSIWLVLNMFFLISIFVLDKLERNR